MTDEKAKRRGGCLRIVAVGVGAIFVMLLTLYLGGYLIDGEVEVSTEARVDAPRQAVYRYLATQPGVIAWWTDVARHHEGAAPGMDVVAGDGPEEGPGTTVRFEAGGTVAEEWEILTAEPPSRVVWNVDFQVMEVERTFALHPDDGGTRVVWSETGHIDNPAARYMTLFMDDEETIGNFDAALEGLARVAEGPADGGAGQ